MSDASKEISKWVEEYSDHLFSWAFHKTSSKEVAEDLLQETFVGAIKSYSNFRQESNPKTWLLSILNNKINDHFRNLYRKTAQEDDRIFSTFFDETGHWTKSESPTSWEIRDEEHLLDNLDFRQELLNCLERLPKNWFSVIHFKYLEEKKGKEICQELDITNTNFWQILYRAKLQLRKCLELNWFAK